MTQALYDANGNAVRILRPWETTENKYSIGIARKDTVGLIDNQDSSDGGLLRGIVADDGKVDPVILLESGSRREACDDLVQHVSEIQLFLSASDVALAQIDALSDIAAHAETKNQIGARAIKYLHVVRKSISIVDVFYILFVEGRTVGA